MRITPFVKIIDRAICTVFPLPNFERAASSAGGNTGNIDIAEVPIQQPRIAEHKHLPLWPHAKTEIYLNIKAV